MNKSFVTIYHNPDCETSCNVLKYLRDAGLEPVVVEYLQIGWTRELLVDLFTAARLTPRTALRETKSPAAELGLLDPAVPDSELMEMMLKHPILVNRPIVVTPRETRLCRPSNTVLELIEKMSSGSPEKSDVNMKNSCEMSKE